MGAYFPIIFDVVSLISILFPTNIFTTFGTFSTSSGYH